MDIKQRKYSGVFSGDIDYKQKLNEIIDDLYLEVAKISVEEMRIKLEIIIDAYIDEVGERPDQSPLSRMANLLLHAELVDRNPKKVTHAEYPVLSDRQLERRADREVPLYWADEVGTNGEGNRLRTRDNNRKMRESVGGRIRRF